MRNYQVTAAIEEEKNLIKAITAEINHLMAMKNGITSTVRSYRARYRYWRNNIMQDKAMDSNLVRLIKEYNTNLASLNQIKEIDQDTDIPPLLTFLDALEQAVNELKQYQIDGINDQISNVQANINETRRIINKLQQSEDSIDIKRHNQDLRNAYEDEVAQAKVEYHRQMVEYEKQLEDYQKRAKEVVSIQEAADYFNDSIAHGTPIFSLVTRTTLRINIGAISELATALLDQYWYSNETLENDYGDDGIFQFSGINWEGLQELYNDGNLATVKQKLERGITKTTERWKYDIETTQVAKVQELETSKPKEPQMREINKPSYLSEENRKSTSTSLPRLGQFIGNGTQFAQQVISGKLLSEMDSYLTGPYKITEEHVKEINDLAERMGNNCPRLVFEDNSFNNTKLLHLLDNLEDNFSSFGSQRNSSKGQDAIERLKNSVDGLEDAKNYTDLKDASEQFSLSSSLMIMWLTSNWWQNGGKPEGDAHPWKGKYARRLKKPR